jgi:hypothetical protein
MNDEQPDETNEEIEETRRSAVTPGRPGMNADHMRTI